MGVGNKNSNWISVYGLCGVGEGLVLKSSIKLIGVTLLSFCLFITAGCSLDTPSGKTINQTKVEQAVNQNAQYAPGVKRNQEIDNLDLVQLAKVVFENQLRYEEDREYPNRIKDYNIESVYILKDNSSGFDFSVSYSILPASDDYVLAGNGAKADNGWIAHIFNFVTVAKTDSYYKITQMATSPQLEDVNSSHQHEIVNTVENGGNPIELVINVGPAYAPKYVTLGRTTVVGRSTEIPIFITLKNIDILPPSEAEKQKKPQIVISVNQKKWACSLKNYLSENTVNYSIETDDFVKQCDVTIGKIFDKENNQVLN